jgi:hypothetical protein
LFEGCQFGQWGLGGFLFGFVDLATFHRFGDGNVFVDHHGGDGFLFRIRIGRRRRWRWRILSFLGGFARRCLLLDGFARRLFFGLALFGQQRFVVAVVGGEDETKFFAAGRRTDDLRGDGVFFFGRTEGFAPGWTDGLGHGGFVVAGGEVVFAVAGRHDEE